ncbi:hypothetical protein BH11BAC2_BH11BAC2_06940 [soil metagenome]
MKVFIYLLPCSIYYLWRVENLNYRLANESDIGLIYQLAEKIWKIHYPTIITHAQIDFMLDKMYSKVALLEQMNNGHQFWILYQQTNPIGYLSYSRDSEEEYFLNKLYLNPDYHIKGIGSWFMHKIFDILPNKSAIRLTVNRKNFTAINFYFKNGFFIEKVEDFDIGNGFFMNDFVMIKKFTPSASIKNH